MNNVAVKLIDLPCSIRAYVVRCSDNGDAFFTIMLNARMSQEQRIKSYRHEIEHIEHDDFSRVISVDALERMRHSYD